MDKADRELLGRLVDATERGAKAQEDLIALATEERDSVSEDLPPVCPRCNAFDPTISNEGGHGQMSEFVLVASCGNCGSAFLAIPQHGWLTFRNKPEYDAHKEGRTE